MGSDGWIQGFHHSQSDYKLSDGAILEVVGRG